MFRNYSYFYTQIHIKKDCFNALMKSVTAWSQCCVCLEMIYQVLASVAFSCGSICGTAVSDQFCSICWTSAESIHPLLLAAVTSSITSSDPVPQAHNNIMFDRWLAVPLLLHVFPFILVQNNLGFFCPKFFFSFLHFFKTLHALLDVFWWIPCWFSCFLVWPVLCALL